MMGSRACVGFLSVLFLVSGHLASAQNVPSGSRDVWKFIETLKYTEDPRRGDCFSFDFRNAGSSDTFNYREKDEGGSLTEKTGTIQSVREPNDDWFCVEYTLQGDSSSKYVWMSQGNDRHAARASDCAGVAPASMYRSTMDNAMCGEIPNIYENGVFSFHYDNDPAQSDCYSFNLGNSLEPSDMVPSVCNKAWGSKQCWPNSVEVEKINYKDDGATDWTCVGMRFPEESDFEYLELWLGSGGGQNDQAAVREPPQGALCETDTVPPAPEYPTNEKECPSLPEFGSVKRYTDNSICHSFDLTTEPYVGSEFQYCRDRDDTWATSKAFCYPASVTKILEASNYYCVEFEWYYDEIKALVITDSTSAKVFDGSCSDVSSNPDTENLQNKRCEGLPPALQDTTIRFHDFDGLCHSFDFDNNPPAGGQSYSEFGYCNGGFTEADGEQYPYNKPNCDGRASIWTIQTPEDSNWYCIRFNTSISTPGQHLWVDENGENAVLSSDCLSKPVLDFRRSEVSMNKVCHDLPSPLRNQLRFWDRTVDNGDGYPVCNSFDFSKRLVKDDQANGVFDGYDEFMYCRGVGGQRNCTLPRNSDEDDMNYARVTDFNHDDTYGWSCVEFSSPEIGGALWLSDEGIEMPGVFKSGGSCNSNNRPSDMTEWSALENGECPVMPENTRRENQVLQGVGRGGQSGSCASLDLTGHPGYDDGNQDMFEFCTGNGHCNNAKLFNLSDSGGMTCLSFSYETAYGLPDKHRSFVMSEDGGSAKLTASCKNIDSSDLADVTHRMCERLPGELQKGFFFLQDGTRATLELSHNPNEQDTSFVFCGNYRSANEVCRCAQLKHVINPDQGDKNWYCMTFEFDSAYGIDEDQHLWLNPHHYGWNKGAAQFKKDCSGTPPSPSPTPDVQGEFKVRDTANIPNVCPTATPSPSPGGGSSSSLSDSPGGIAGAVVGSLAGLGLLIGGGIFAKKKLGGKTSAREEVVSNEMPSAVTAGNPAAEGQAENAYTQRRSVDNPVRNIPSE